MTPLPFEFANVLLGRPTVVLSALSIASGTRTEVPVLAPLRVSSTVCPSGTSAGSTTDTAATPRLSYGSVPRTVETGAVPSTWSPSFTTISVSLTSAFVDIDHDLTSSFTVLPGSYAVGEPAGN